MPPSCTPAFLLAAGVSLLPALQMGFAIGVLNTLEPELATWFNVSRTHPFGWPLAVALLSPAALAGSALLPLLSARLGRRSCLALATFPFVLGGLCFLLSSPLAAASGDGWFLVFLCGRALVGVGAGVGSVLVPTYLGEIAPKAVRAYVGGAFQVAVVCGILISQALGIFWPPRQWGTLLGLTTTLGVVNLLLTLPLVIESPAWLFTHGDEKAASVSLRRLRASSTVSVGDFVDPEVGSRHAETHDAKIHEELKELTACLERHRASAQSLSDVWRDKSLHLPAIVMLAIMSAQQLSGINAVIYYSTAIFSGAGMENSGLFTFFVSSFNLLATGMSIPVIERLGRRPTLLCGTAGMIISLVGMTAGMVFARESQGSFTSALLVVGALCYVCFFELGLGIIPWQLGSDMLPQHAKDNILGLATTTNWLLNFVVGCSFPLAAHALGDWCLLPFVLTLGAFFLFALKYIPETKGRSVAECVSLVNRQRNSPSWLVPKSAD